MRALGRDAGRLAATGNGNVYIGAGMTGVQGEKGKKGSVLTIDTIE
jgi:hypothetical protein